ncbi:hypothetical protein E4T56_gene9680 [Termitomyces sp. T112]|nr:hypothetical protein E4T56_gene9680 [Termitomyces sp. T112]
MACRKPRSSNHSCAPSLKGKSGFSANKSASTKPAAASTEKQAHSKKASVAHVEADTAANAAGAPPKLTRTEHQLEDSSISVAPPQHQHDLSATLPPHAIHATTCACVQHAIDNDISNKKDDGGGIEKDGNGSKMSGKEGAEKHDEGEGDGDGDGKKEQVEGYGEREAEAEGEGAEGGGVGSEDHRAERIEGGEGGEEGEGEREGERVEGERAEGIEGNEEEGEDGEGGEGEGEDGEGERKREREREMREMKGHVPTTPPHRIQDNAKRARASSVGSDKVSKVLWLSTAHSSATSHSVEPSTGHSMSLLMLLEHQNDSLEAPLQGKVYLYKTMDKDHKNSFVIQQPVQNQLGEVLKNLGDQYSPISKANSCTYVDNDGDWVLKGKHDKVVLNMEPLDLQLNDHGQLFTALHAENLMIGISSMVSGSSTPDLAASFAPSLTTRSSTISANIAGNMSENQHLLITTLEISTCLLDCSKHDLCYAFAKYEALQDALKKLNSKIKDGT